MSSIGTKLDADQVIKQAYDEPNNRIRVDAEVTATIGTVTVEIDAAAGDNIAISDGVDTVAVNPDGSLNVNVISPLEVEISAADGDNIAISDGVDTLAVNTNGSINVVGIQLFTLPFDAITATYPSATQEAYASRVGGTGGVVQQTVTINYTDSTKNFILNVART